jgi:hypothetical protein
MGGVVKTLGSLIGIGGQTKTPEMPKIPDYEETRKKAEEEALKRRAALAGRGMSGAILGGSTGDDSAINKKKLLGQ